MPTKKKQDCFIIMPISDPDGYEPGHFKRVYEDIINPACEKAEFKAIRADDVEETDIIHINILKQIVEAPMAICDLSTRNPNVLFELGLRQAFDKPVVIIQEKGTERIFDVSILRAYGYCKELRYNEVLNDQESISKMLKGTEESCITGKGFNSVINLLSLAQSAKIKSIDDPNEQLKIQLYQLSVQMKDIRTELKASRDYNKGRNERIHIREVERQSEIEQTTYIRFMDAYNRNDIDEMRNAYNFFKKKFHNSKESNYLLMEMASIMKNAKLL